MQNSDIMPSGATPLTTQEQDQLFEELTQQEETLDRILQGYGATRQELKDLVVLTDEMKDPQGDDLALFLSVNEAQLCAKNITDLERWIDTGTLQPEDFSHDIIQRSGIIPVVTMDDEYTAKVLTAPKVNRYNLVELYLRGFMVFEDNLEGLKMNQNNVEKAIEARKPSELELTIPLLTAALNKLGMANIKQAQDELLAMFQQQRNRNAEKRQAAVSAIPALTNVLQIHQKICELTIASIVRKQNLQKSINIASVRDVEKLLASEAEKFNQIQDQGIMGKTHPRLADLTSLRNLIIEKERTEKVLEGPEPVPFWELPNWLADNYLKQAYPKRLEMLSQLLQQNLLGDYSEALTSETEIESCPEYKDLQVKVSSKITSQLWEIVSQILYFYFLRGDVNVHCAMKIYYQNQLKPISEPLDMKDAHENLKKISPSVDQKDEYDTIINFFSNRKISETLQHIRDEGRIPDKSFSSQLEQALEPVVNRKSNTLLNILEGFIETLGASSSFKKIKVGLLSRKEEGDYDSICGFLDLEREKPDQQYLDALKEVLRKYIADFDKKREDELTRQMIEVIKNKFTGLEQMVNSKEYSDLIKLIEKLNPREITPTIESALCYQKRCTSLIAAFKEALILQSKEEMTKLANYLPMSSEDFTDKMRFFQESLDQEKSFYLILPGLDQKIQALNDQGSSIFFDQKMNLTNPIYTEFVHKVSVYMENLSGRYPVDDANWTQSLEKLCILCAQFPTGEFESLRNKIHAHFSDMIKSDLKKRYNLVIEDRSIVRNFQDEQEGNGGQRPAHTFKQLMLSINQVKTNVEKMLAVQITASLSDLDVIVKKFIQSITKSIREYLESLFNKQLVSLLNKTSTTNGVSPSTPEYDIDGIQAALNLIENFAQSATQFQFNEISDELRNLTEYIVQSGARAFQEQQSNFFGLLESHEPQSQEIKILENTDIKQMYNQFINLRKISQINLATQKNFTEIQKKIMQTVKTKSNSIRISMSQVEKGGHRQYSTSEKEAFFEGILQVVEEYGYFQSILEQDQQQQEKIKKDMSTIFDTCMRQLYGNIDLQQVEDPKYWQEVLKVGVSVDDYVKIKSIFAKIGLNTNQTHNDNVRKGFDQSVSTAMRTIVSSLSQPIVFMNPDHYQDFSNYYKYLEILQKNQDIYLPDEQQQKLAQRMMDHIKFIVQQQIQKLNETFQYRFRRYLFSDSNEPNNYCYHKRPSPIQFSLEEGKAEPDSAEGADKSNLDQRLDEACKEIYSLVEVTHWLMQQFINEERLTQETSQTNWGSAMKDILNRLQFKRVTDLYSLFKRSLLDTFFDGFNMKKERLKYETLKDESLFHQKQRVVHYLRRVDKFFDLQSLVRDAEQLTSLQLRQNFKNIFDSLDKDIFIQQSLVIASKCFEEALNLEVRDETTRYKTLYYEKQYKKLSEDLIPQVEYIKIQMKDCIKQESGKLINFLQQKTQDFKDAVSEAEGICHSVLYLNAHVQFLPEYVDATFIDNQIQKAIRQLEEVIHEIFKSINELSVKYFFDQVFKKLFSIDAFIKKMQNSRESLKLDLIPSNDSLADFYTQMIKLIKDNKLLITESFRKMLQDYEDAIPIGLDQLEIVHRKYGCTSGFIIDSIEKLEQKELDWSDIKTLISSFISSSINKIKSYLGSFRTETVTEQTQLLVIRKSINNLKEILKFFPEAHFGHLNETIKEKAEGISHQSQVILQNQIDQLFQDEDFEGIAKAIRENPEVIDQRFTENLKSKFIKLIKPVCKKGQEIICAEKVNPEELQQFINHKVPKITLFFEDDEFNPFIVEKCHHDFSKIVKLNLTYLYGYALRYILKKIELGSKAVPVVEKDLERERGPERNLKLNISNYLEALNILDNINQSKYKLKVIETYDLKLSEFFSQCTEIIRYIINKWKESIKTNNAQQIVILVDDLVANDKLFQHQQFTRTFEIDFNEEGKMNHELMITVRDAFRGEEPKKILHDWGKNWVYQLAQIDFVKNAVKNTSKHERSSYYGQFIKIYQDLEEVTKKAKPHIFFKYGPDHFCYSETAQTDMIEKVQKLKSSFRKLFSENLANGQRKNLLVQKNSKELDKNFQNIISGYLNLESILEHFIIIEKSMQAEIKQSLEEFRIKVSDRINSFVEDAKFLYTKPPQIKDQFIDLSDLKRFAEIIIEIQLMKNNFTQIQSNISTIQDQIIDDYDLIQEEKQNKLRLQSLMRLIEAQDWGAQIINDCSAFQGEKQKALAKKLNTKTIDDVLKEIKGEDISVNNNILKGSDNLQEKPGNKGRALLKQNYERFQEQYQKKLKELTKVIPNDKGEIPPIDHSILVREINAMKVKMTKHQWDDKNIEKLPELLSLIFALWSLLKPEQLQKQQKSHFRQQKNAQGQDQEEVKGSEAGDFLYYLNQPHPAQVIGLMRILGIGYSPDEYVDTQQEKGGITQWIFGNPKTKIRNNLVQIKTGEGKSVTLAVLSIVFALCDFDVRCGCYSAYLSDRDFKAFEPMFKILDLYDQIKYDTFNQICEMEINKSGDLRQIMLNLVLNKADQVVIESDQNTRPKILLIDEVDVFFSESFFGNTYMPLAQIKGAEVEALTDYMWQNRDSDLTLKKVLDRVEYKNVLCLFKENFAFLLREAVKQMIVDLRDVEKFKLGVEVPDMNIMDIIDGQIKYKVGDTWSAKVRVSYSTMFAYYHFYYNPQVGKDKITFETFKDYKSIGIKITELSFAEIPLQFPVLLGVTGTLETLSDEQQKIMKTVYNFMSKTYAPSVYDIPLEKKTKEDMIKGLKQEILIMNEAQQKQHGAAVSNDQVEYVNEMTVKILNNKDQQFKELAQRIGKLLESKNTQDILKEKVPQNTETEESLIERQRAVIVFFKSEDNLNEFRECSYIDQLSSFTIGILTDKLENLERDKIVKNATNQGQITLSTREFGRGTDFKYHGSAVIEAGGLAVIQAFFTFDYSEEIQIRGRTRRQGTTGSYEIIVNQQDLIDHFGTKENFVDSLASLDPKQAYKKLHEKSVEQYEEKQKNNMKIRDQLKPKHQEYIKNLENIKLTVKRKVVKKEETEKFIKMLKEINSCSQYKVQERCIKTLVLIDATGSMGNLLKNVQQTILKYFEEVCKSLEESSYDKNLFKIQIAFYRNYSSGQKILSVSDWAGPDQKQQLKTFVDNQTTSGGQGNEAMEVAFWHANKEIYTPSDGGEPVSLIFIIGDAPSNTKQEILSRKYNCGSSVNPSMTDQEALKHGYLSTWNDQLQAKFGPSTTWDTHLERIKTFQDKDGFKIPVQSFYVDDNNKKQEHLQKFYSKLRANNTAAQIDDNRLLDLKNQQSLAVNLCADTMSMIAIKNPEGGNIEILNDKANKMRKFGFA